MGRQWPSYGNQTVVTMFLPDDDGDLDRLGLGVAPASPSRALGVGDASADH